MRRPLGRHRVHREGQPLAIRRAQVAEIRDRLRCALGRDDDLLGFCVWLPDLRHGEQIRAQAVRVHEGPLRPVRVLGSGEMLPTEIVERLLHRIERVLRAREHTELDQVVKRLRQCVRTCREVERRSPFGVRNSATDMRFSVNVPVLSVQSTVAEPSVSMAAARRVRTRAREMRQAPIAMNTVSTTGNSSGSIDMPSAMPASIASSHPPRTVP